MNEKQAEKIIELLTKVVEKLDSIESDVGWTQTHTSSISSTVEAIQESLNK